MKTPTPPGYSGTPLARKLGFAGGTTALARHAPDDYASWLAPLPSGVEWASRIGPKVDLVHVFVREEAVLARELTGLRKTIRSDAAVWVSWPKKASRVPTDISEDRVRAVALPLGFVDVKVCAVNEVWSGLKLVIRKELRARSG